MLQLSTGACYSSLFWAKRYGKYPFYICSFLYFNALAELAGLECSECAGNLINRKITIFYIEAIPTFFSQLRKKNRAQKIISKKFAKKCIFFQKYIVRDFKKYIVNFQIFWKTHYFFEKKNFFANIFQNYFLSSKKNFFFSELRKMFGV